MGDDIQGHSLCFEIVAFFYGQKPLIANSNKQGGEKQCLTINLKLLRVICKKKSRSAVAARRTLSAALVAKKEINHQYGVSLSL